MWVVNPSEEEEKGLINLRDVVPGTASGGQLALDVWFPGAAPPRGYCRGGVDMEGGGTRVHRGAFGETLHLHLTLASPSVLSQPPRSWCMDLQGGECGGPALP